MRTVVVLDEDPLARWRLYQGLEEMGVPVEVLPRLTAALPRVLRLPGGVLLLGELDGHWGVSGEALVEGVRDWLTARQVEGHWLLRQWTPGPAVSTSFVSLRNTPDASLGELLQGDLRTVARSLRG